MLYSRYRLLDASVYFENIKFDGAHSWRYGCIVSDHEHANLSLKNCKIKSNGTAIFFCASKLNIFGCEIVGGSLAINCVSVIINVIGCEFVGGKGIRIGYTDKRVKQLKCIGNIFENN